MSAASSLRDTFRFGHTQSAEVMAEFELTE